MKIILDLQIASKEKTIPKKQEFNTWVKTATEHLHTKKDIELTIRIVDTEEITALNKTYRNKNKPTNVLSFPFTVPSEIPINLIGDIIICAPIIQQEALAHNKLIKAHWAHITIHGLLHLLSYDHVTEEQAKNMEALEIEILKKLSFDNPYSSVN